VTDVGARLVARYMSKYLPGSPHIVVQNMPGANGITAANYLYAQVEPDGLTSLAGSSSQVTPDVIRANPSVRYDLTKFAWIGGLYNEGTLVVATRAAGERLQKQTGDPVVAGQVGGARTEALVAVWAAEYLGWKVRFVTGYPGTPQIVIAMMSGEVEMMNSSGLAGLDQMLKQPEKFATVMQTGVYNDGKLRPRPGFETTPLINEALDGKMSGAGKRAFDGWLDSIQIGKYFALPPKTPAAYLMAYREAFNRMVIDLEFQAQAPAAFEPGYVMMTADEVKTLIDRMGATPEDDYKYVDRLREKYGLASERRGSN
jgi:tripartite-type tricarboxylate transporter receptor subunit TctC